jgi:glycosyltransferase involved in cell wall biosynthesis
MPPAVRKELAAAARAMLHGPPRTDLPAWLLDEWRAIHAVEPELFPDRIYFHTAEHHEVPPSRLAPHYLDLHERLGPSPSHVFLLPWLIPGGADLEALNYLRALAEEKGAEGLAALTTEDQDSPWAARLPPGVRLVEFGRRYASLPPDLQRHLLARVLLQKAPPVVHNINSRLGYDLFVRHGRALARYSRLYCSAFCEDFTPDGKVTGYPFKELPDCFEHLTAVLGDNQRFLTRLHELYAFDPGKLRVHYQPAALRERRRTSAPRPGDRLNVLWAGRLDRQKRPDLLLDVARRCRDGPFHFHVYGRWALVYDAARVRFRGEKNVTYHGPFNGFASLPVDEMDLFLYTSQWDGLPNVLLEAMGSGLPVVASRVGGIGELVIPGQTGFLVDPYDDAGRYAEALRTAHADRRLLAALAENASALLASRHSWGQFLQEVRSVPGYLAASASPTPDAGGRGVLSH